VLRRLVLVGLLAACSRGGGDATAPPGVRVVSLMPSGTEIVAALDAAPLLVGVDQYSEYPESVKALPKVGSFLAPDIEAIVRLKPTFVVLDDVHGQVAAALHDHGVATVGCAVHALSDVKACMRAVGTRLGTPAVADAAIAAIDRALDAAAAKRPAQHPRVLAIIDRDPDGLGNLVAAGPGSYLDELLAVVGADNVLAATGERYPKIAVEEVLRARPEVILDLSGHGADAWKQLGLPARVHSLTADYLRGPSPRVAPALEALSAALRP
jgi:iron complex transport system substrate-binding protein